MANHPETDLVPYVRGELAAAERERVARHLDECADCRQDADDLRELLSKLALSAPPAPAVHWGRYRAELREKLEARRARRRGGDGRCRSCSPPGSRACSSSSRCGAAARAGRAWIS